MFKATALYGHPTDPDAFERYYAETHMPLVAKMAGPVRTEAARVVGTPSGEKPAYYRVFEFWFESMEQLQASFGSKEGAAVMADVPNYATGGVTLLISTVD